MITEKRQKTPKKITCEKCNFICSKSSDYNRHLLTAKHKMITNDNQKTPTDITSYNCVCGKIYQFKSGLSRHKKVCLFEEKLEEKMEEKMEEKLEENNNLDYKDMFIEMMKENRELHKTIHEIIPKIGNTNNSFNIQIFLNLI